MSGWDIAAARCATELCAITDTADAAALIQRIETLARSHGGTMTMMFSISIPEALVLNLLAMPRTASVIFAAEPNLGFTDVDERIGLIRPDGRVGKTPSVVGDLVLVFGDAEAFGFELTRLSLRRGGRRILFDSPLGFTRSKSLWAMLASRFCRGVNKAIDRRAADLTSPGRFGLLDPVLGRFWRFVLWPLSAASRDRRRLTRLASRIQTAPVIDNTVPGRLVFVTGSLGPGGAEHQLVNTLNGLATKGANDMHLLADRLSPKPYDFYRPKVERIEGLSIVELGSVYPDDQTDLLELETLIQNVPKTYRISVLKLICLFRRLRPEIVHAWQDGCCAKAGIAAVLAGVDRVVLSWRSLNPVAAGRNHPWYAPIFRALAARDNVVMLNNSAAGASSYADWLRFSPAKINVIRNGVDFSNLVKPKAEAIRAYRDSLGIPPNALVLGTVFRFAEVKQPMLWLETAANVAERRQDIHFLMIGDGPLHDRVKAAALKRALDDRIHLPGQMTTPALAFAAMDLFLLTSVFEGLPNVIVEAGALGIPVVSTDVGGVRETFIQGKTGAAVAANKPDPIADKIIELFANEAWRKEAATLSPSWMRKRFGIDRMIEETLAAYRDDSTQALASGSTTLSKAGQTAAMTTEPGIGKLRQEFERAG